jgi:hypothetical protein
VSEEKTCTARLCDEWNPVECGAPARFEDVGGPRCFIHAESREAVNARLVAAIASAERECAKTDAIALVRRLAADGHAEAQDIVARLW